MRLIIFTRYPEAGKVKTRLISVLSPFGARKLHREMAEHTLKQVRSFGGEIEVRFVGSNTECMKEWLGEGLIYREQKGRGLGERLYRAIETSFLEGKDKVVVIGTDCPELTTAHIKNAFSLLEKVDLVIGPALDGGYYLIGLRKAHRKLFEDIPWGSRNVFQETLEAARLLNLKAVLLEKLADVDRPEDLPAWYNRK